MQAALLKPSELEPQQERSRATRRRILTAANLLLLHRSFDSLSVQEIATTAGCSIGAFYGRFRGKDDLLGPLLDRHNRAIERWLRVAVADPSWRSKTLEQRLEWIARMDVRVLRSRRWLLRALSVYLRQDAARLTEVQNRRRTEFTQRVRELLLDRVDRPTLAQRQEAVDFALFLIATLCRERVLFGELSARSWIPEGDEALVREVSVAALAYLTGGAAPPAGGRRA